MRTVDVAVPPGPPSGYRIRIGVALPDGVAAALTEIGAGAAAIALISDDVVAPLYGEPLARELERYGARSGLFRFPAGERHKARQTVATLQDELIDGGYGRDCWIAALGGGVVGDVAGFVAATLFRGVPYVQVPTSLLAMVDSSVGGKTGVDTDAGKNLVGAFYQPRAVLVDVSTLDTLPDAELAAGLAEVIKYGVIVDADLFARLEDGLVEACLERSRTELERVVRRCCELKAQVVVADERESDLRQILNFGHTVGHALEAVLGFEMRHGPAVAIGMVVEARLAESLVGAPAGTAERIAALCSRTGLPTGVPDDCDADALLAAAKRDKKARGGEIRCALPAAFGRMHRGVRGYGIGVSEGEMRSALAASA